MSLWDTTGVVHLRDLSDRHRWDTRKLPAYLDRLGGSLGGLEGSAFLSPACLIVLNRAEDTDLWARYRCWLSGANELYPVVCHYEPSTQDSRDRLEAEILSSLPGLPVRRVVHWEKGTQAPEPLPMVLEGSTSHPPPPGPLPLWREPVPPGPWVEMPTPPEQSPELTLPRWCCLKDGRPQIYHPRQGAFLNLTNGGGDR